MHNQKRGKNIKFEICATSVIFKKLPKVNNRPMSENSPNLVTLERSTKQKQEVVLFQNVFRKNI
jgi:hypothetical protein